MKRLIPQSYTTARSFSITNRLLSGCIPRYNYGPMEVQRTEMLNGMKVAAAKMTGAQICSCTIMFQAGSRYEMDDTLGATHFLRALSSAAGRGYTSFSKSRVLQQNGAYLTCSSDRQTISFTLRCPLPVFSELKYYLLDTAARCCYNPWDIKDRLQLIKDDLFRVNPEQHVIDLIQKACWGGPLSNSMFCEEERIGSMSQEALCRFVCDNFKSNCCTVASVGVPFEDTMKIAEKIDNTREKPVDRYILPSFPRAGFQYHDLGPDSDTWIAVAIPGCGTYDLSCLMKHAMIAAACGTDNTQCGLHHMDRIPQPPLGLMAGDDVFTHYKAFNISYCDTGVFGILAKTRACSAKPVAFAISEFLASVADLDFKQIEAGKNRLKLSLALHEEDCTKVSEGLALQLANNIQMDNAKICLSLVDALGPDEISATAKELSAKKHEMAVAVVGDVDAVPHDQELLSGRLQLA